MTYHEYETKLKQMWVKIESIDSREIAAKFIQKKITESIKSMFLKIYAKL